MKFDYQEPVVLERCFASYVVGEESRESIFSITKPMGYIYRSEYPEVTPDGKAIITLEIVRQTTLANYLINASQ